MSMSRRQSLLAAGAAVAAGTALAAPAVIRPRPAQAAAPMMGPTRPTFYRFELGAFEVTPLLDGVVQADGPHPIFGEDQPPEAVAELAEANFLSPSRIENAFTPVLVNTGEALVLFDAGNAPGRPGTGNLVAVLEAAGYAPADIDILVITHFHGDHIGGLMRDGAPTFPNARYVTGEAEYAFWTHDDRLAGPTENAANLVRANVVPFAEQMTFLGDEGEVVPGINALAAFGHTPGHMAYRIESEGEPLLLWADAANHFVLSVQRPDWHVRFDMDKEEAAATRRRLFDMANADRLPVTGYHMPFPAVGFIDKSADGGYRWVPVSYQMNI
jgi:glyoxylase-like metal-dependent hydrolase (beta-lactamase superfamily II)